MTTAIVRASGTADPAHERRRRGPSVRALVRARRQVTDWFAGRGWRPFPFQRQAWDAYLAGQSGLIHASTGMGKSYAVWMGPLIEALAATESPATELTAAAGKLKNASPRRQRRTEAPALRVLWVTPLRALAADTWKALHAPLEALQIPWTVETRTSDTAASTRSRQATRLPTVLITTPESLSILLSQPDASKRFAELKLIVADEWHELLSTKRGVQAELAFARLRRWSPGVQTWGLSATLGNQDEALQVLLGASPGGPAIRPPAPSLCIRGHRAKRLIVETIIPESIERFPWAGHIGLKLAGEVAERLERAGSTLVFTNTRAQTEAWYQALLRERPDWAGRIALHHGSLDRDTRSWVEEGLRTGKLKGVVCTSSLDLGVDFSPVEQVLQVGSPKGVARLLQRAGRSGHSPGRASRVTCVPTHALELLEVAAARDAMAAGAIEARRPPPGPLDVLTQHAVTIAVGGGFHSQELLDEVRQTYSYRSLTEADWDWVLQFVTTGGQALAAYPDYRKVRIDATGRYHVDDSRIARQHRLSIGTIVSDASLTVQYLQGGRLGTIDESFLTKFHVGDQFVFAGKLVELVAVQDATIWVRRARGVGRPRIPRWMGGRMPLSTELSTAIRQKLDEAARGEFQGAEMSALRPLLQLQEAWSHLPRVDELLIERMQSREGHHLFLYPFAGRLVHEGLAALVAYRLARLAPLTFSMSVNDYGFELLSAAPAPLDQALVEGLFDPDHLLDDIGACMNATEMSKRQFREIAHISGLVFGGYPGSRKTARQLQASTGLLYDVFKNYDPSNRLLQQAEQEVLERQLEQARLQETLAALQRSVIREVTLPRFSPLSFPLMVDRLRQRLSSEKLADRVRRMIVQLEKAAGQS